MGMFGYKVYYGYCVFGIAHDFEMFWIHWVIFSAILVYQDPLGQPWIMVQQVLLSLFIHRIVFSAIWTKGCNRLILEVGVFKKIKMYSGKLLFLSLTIFCFYPSTIKRGRV